MIIRRLVGGLSAILLAAQPIAAQQMTVEQAREEGKAMAQEKRNDSSLVPSSDAQAQAVPGYTGTSQPQTTYYDDPDKLVAEAQAQKTSSQSYRISTDADHTRPTFSNDEILATTDRATQVENDPSAYLAGQDISSGSGTCTPLPPGSGAGGYYEATCNFGTKVDQSAPVCRTPLVVDATPGTDKYIYTCENWSRTAAQGGDNRDRRCVPTFNAPVQSGVCRERSRQTVYYDVCRQGNPRFCTEPDIEEGEVITYECDSAAVARPYTVETVGQVINERRDETMCDAATAGQTCELASETCVDQEPTTRTINGVEVTRACWNWERTYSCHQFSQANDCTDLENNRQCTYLRDECLDDPPDGPCKVSQKVYRCPTPDDAPATDKQYICGNDVYCINGDCEPIVREASTEFKDALVGLHALDQAGKEFNEADLKVFSGTRETCHKPVFGLVNCCAGKVSGAVPVAAGAAALAGGPLAIAAFATPFLVLFSCSQDEMKLDIKDRMGFCHNVGTYCSSSFLGICSTKRTAYCCFESKLSRILQEQGRVQLNKPWGSAKKEQCQGFTIEEFASLDLSKMDFTEVYSDFMDAAKLPDEVQTMSDIQDKIQAYYDLHRQ
ncbi:conjugal transfer protein TraN (plasmid) [Sphingomonas panacis]|uniref:Conjugal transfer protein TraN n=1 Tax=Sphingomonas panacis TaxID=1560345 RepID=A0A1B3ZIK8_9SPHN|nr:conjugal transfer protein TraN [Sphingomonas panacis]AOH87260.1 conjugal transfer protein TraN [Sphingomonas panacis]